MKPAQPDDTTFITLRQAASILGVTVETLLEWNDSNILKPIISQTGVIGYKQQQIDKFLAVQQYLQQTSEDRSSVRPDANNSQATDSKKGFGAEVSIPVVPKTNSGTVEVSTDIMYQIDSDINKAKLITVGIASAALVILSSLTISAFVPGNPLLPNKIAGNIKPASENIKLSQQANEAGTISTAGKIQQASADNVGITVPDETIDSPITARDKNSSATAKLDIKTMAFVPVGEQEQTSNYTSRPNLQNNSRNGTLAEDTDGVTDDPSRPDSLASVFGTFASSDADHPLGRKINLGIIITSLGLGLMWAIYAYKQQPVYSSFNANAASTNPSMSMTEIALQKAIEVEQKTDGTVVIYFQGEEYKISKPELNSETDRLIQRLISLTGNTKELEYDILEDEKIQLNSPLSKIVTRLGFIGTKRDLFFPRTSKNKVVFRKYLTKQELDSLGLEKDKIISELVS